MYEKPYIPDQQKTHAEPAGGEKRRKRIMKRKVLSLLTAMALTVSALAGCGSSDSESAGDAKTEEAAETEE